MRIFSVDKSRHEAIVHVYESGSEMIGFRLTREGKLVEFERIDDSTRGGLGIAPRHVEQARQMAAEALA